MCPYLSFFGVYKFCQSQFSLHYCFFIGFGMFVVLILVAPLIVVYIYIYIVNLLPHSFNSISNIFLLVLFIRQICEYYLLWWFCCSLTRPINFWWIYMDMVFRYLSTYLYVFFLSSFRYMPIYEMIFICFIVFFFQSIKYCDNLCSDHMNTYFYDSVSVWAYSSDRFFTLLYISQSVCAA